MLATSVSTVVNFTALLYNKDMTKTNLLIKTLPGVTNTETGAIIESPEFTPNSLQTKAEENKYDSTWLNAEITHQLDLLKSNPNIKSQIQLYKLLDYSKAKFDYWLDLNGNKPLTQDLLKKRNEIIEANLVEEGLTAKNWAFIIFLLKNNHNYQDNRTIDNNQNYTFNVTRGLATTRKKVKVIL